MKYIVVIEYNEYDIKVLEFTKKSEAEAHYWHLNHAGPIIARCYEPKKKLKKAQSRKVR